MDDPITTATQRVFRQLSITAPLAHGQSLENLQNVGPMCSELTIVVGRVNPSPTRDRPRSWRQRFSDTVRSVQQDTHVASPLWESIRNGLRRQSTRSLDSDTSEAPFALTRPSTPLVPAVPTLPLSAPTQPILTVQDRAQKNQADQSAIEYWTSVFSCFSKINTLTFSIRGDTGWPGSTEVEYVLVILRAALELTDLPHLQRVRFQPIHAMGVVVMRWHGFAAMSKAPAEAYKLWQGITSLDIQIHNPFKKLSDKQNALFHHVLHDYLSSFSNTVKRLRFIWLGESGPSPLALEREEAIKETHQPIYWEVLEELWLGNITLLDRTIRIAVTQYAPNIRSLKTLRPDLQQISTVFEQQSSWVNVILPTHARPQAHQGWWDVIDTHEEPRESYVTNTSAGSQEGWT